MNIPSKITIEAKDFNKVSPQALKVAMKKAAQGNHKAFRVIFNAFYEPLARWMMKEFKIELSVAHELSSEVVAKVWEKSSKYNPEMSNVTTWIFTIAKFHFIDYTRRTQSKSATFAIYELLFEDGRNKLPEFEAHSLDSNPEELMIQEEASEYIGELFTEKVLGKALFSIMELRYVKELSMKEIAVELKMNDSTVRVQLRRGRLKIQEFLSTNYEMARQFALPQFAL